MIAILRKEFHAFFASPIGYLVITVFLVVNGLFLWVFKGPFNILNAGFADLNSFFFIAPWFFVFLMPAVTMRSFSDEIKAGTIETLKTRPLTNTNIVAGKFLSALLLITIALLPTLTYVYTISTLGNPPGNLDTGSIIGSYAGLVFLAGAFTSIGLFTSSLSSNQIVAFISGTVISFFMFYGFDAIAGLKLFSAWRMETFGMQYHFNSMARGVIDSRDIIYFLSVSFFFLYITTINLKTK